MICDAPISADPPGLVFDVEEQAIDTVLSPPDDTFIARLGPFQEPDGVTGQAWDYSSNTVRIFKTLTLIGPQVPIKVSWDHHSINPGTFEDTVTPDSLVLSASNLTYTWPEGDDYEYDDNFVFSRHI